MMSRGKISQIDETHTIVRDFIDRADSVQEAIEEMQFLFDIEHITFHLSKTCLGAVDSPFVRSTYPASWISQYLLSGFVDVDPVVSAGFSRMLPFHWSDLEIDPVAELLMREFQKQGLGASGFSIPVIDKNNRRSLLSFTSLKTDQAFRAYIRKHLSDLTEIAHAMHKRAIEEAGLPDFIRLGPRELECLSWVAKGKDAGTIAEILLISESTVRSYYKSIRYKMNCATMAQAVAKAIVLRLIHDIDSSHI